MESFHLYFLVEAVGIEPTSEDTPEVTSYMLSRFSISHVAGPETDKYTAIASR